MLLVVFGAGASFDSVLTKAPQVDLRAGSPGEPDTFSGQREMMFRPPLTQDLFEPRGPFAGSLTSFPMCQGLVGVLRLTVEQGLLVEDELERRRNLAVKGGRMASELLALQYYLWQSFAECSRRWHDAALGVTNYAILLSYLDSYRAATNDDVMFVTFNYDTMVERALEARGVTLSNLEEYCRDDDISLVKVHGSVRWRRLTTDRLPDGLTDNEIIEAAPALSEEYVQGPDRYIDGRAAVPAVAVPARGKQNFVCPPEHLEFLRARVSEVTKTLVIGWAGNDQHFIELFSGFRPTNVLVVDQDEETATRVARSLAPECEGIQVFGAPARDAYGNEAEVVGFSKLVRTPRVLGELLSVDLDFSPLLTEVSSEDREG